jgi:hypothetical protein
MSRFWIQESRTTSKSHTRGGVWSFYGRFFPCNFGLLIKKNRNKARRLIIALSQSLVCGEIEKLSDINSMAYRTTISSKTNFAIEPKLDKRFIVNKQTGITP